MEGVDCIFRKYDYIVRSKDEIRKATKTCSPRVFSKYALGVPTRQKSSPRGFRKKILFRLDEYYSLVHEGRCLALLAAVEIAPC